MSLAKKRVSRNSSKIQPFIENSKIVVKSETSSNNKIDKNSFNLLHVIGKGGFSKVWVVQSKQTRKLYAMKEMSK